MIYKSKLISRIFTLILAFIFISPIIWVVMASFKTTAQLETYPPSIFTWPPVISGYINIFTSMNFSGIIGNTLFVATISTIITVFICLAGGYALSKGVFRGKDTLALLMIMTLFVGAQVIMVPLFFVIKDLHLLNSLWGLIIPAVFTPTGTFVSLQYMKSIPNELLESANIDGANEWQIFTRIIIPLSTPLIAVLSIFSFTWRWNDFILPLIVINNTKNYTIQMALGMYQGQYNISWDSIMAISTISLIVPIIIFLIFQKAFVRGLMAGGIKY